MTKGQKTEKKLSKNAKSLSRDSITSIKYSVTYFQTLEKFDKKFDLKLEKSNFIKKIAAICDTKQNIAGRLPENSGSRFVDRQSKKKSPKQFLLFA